MTLLGAPGIRIPTEGRDKRESIMSAATPGPNERDDEWDAAEPDRVPGDELDVIASGPYRLYSRRKPTTRWIESDYAVELESWQ